MKQIITFLFLLFTIIVYGQDIKTSDFTYQIKNYDISDLLTLSKFQIENDTTTVDRTEPIGYIGENYQRFHIHFISVIQTPNNKLQYLIYGKTKVKENICSFQGTLTIKKSRTYDEGDVPTLKQGYIQGQYEFFEDPDQKETGILKGIFQTDFYIDEQGKLKYDALMFIADGFDNNQFEGTWTSYNTGKSKKCNWGDYRIPECNWLNGCDTGAGEFSINEKYLKNGWENYRLAWGTYSETSEVIKARQKENEQWWIKK